MSGSSSPRVVVRRAEEGENVLLAEIGAETFFDAFAEYNKAEDMRAYLAEAFNPARQAEELADPRSTFLIAQVHDEVAGYARLLDGDPPEVIDGRHPIEIVRFYARAEWIGRNVGSALMEACLEEATSRGCDVIWLDVWEENVRAIAFYQKWGFEQVGTQKFLLGEDLQDDLVMARPVHRSDGG